MTETNLADLDWYIKQSLQRNLTPRCPFATADRCPRYFQSITVLGMSGETTKVDPDEHARLFDKWKNTDVWPTLDEESTSAWGGSGPMTGFSNFCPEAAFLAFQVFASHIVRHSDEHDRDSEYKRLSALGVGKEDWHWRWRSVTPIHFAECPLYSPLSIGINEIAAERKRPIGFQHAVRNQENLPPIDGATPPQKPSQ